MYVPHPFPHLFPPSRPSPEVLGWPWGHTESRLPSEACYHQYAAPETQECGLHDPMKFHNRAVKSHRKRLSANSL